MRRVLSFRVVSVLRERGREGGREGKVRTREEGREGGREGRRGLLEQQADLLLDRPGQESDGRETTRKERATRMGEACFCWREGWREEGREGGRGGEGGSENIFCGK